MRTHHLSIVQAQLTSAERAILGAFRDSDVMLELYLASECSSRDPARPHLEEIRPWVLSATNESALVAADRAEHPNTEVQVPQLRAGAMTVQPPVVVAGTEMLSAQAA